MNVIVCDLDDTLLIKNKLNEPLAQMLRRSSLQYPIIINTYRKDKQRTVKDLQKHQIPCRELYTQSHDNFIISKRTNTDNI